MTTISNDTVDMDVNYDIDIASDDKVLLDKIDDMDIVSDNIVNMDEDIVQNGK